MELETIALAVDAFINTKRKASTRKAYGYPLTYLMDRFGSSCPVRDISPVMLDVVAGSLNHHHPPLRPKTIDKYIKTWKIFFNYLVKRDILAKSPALYLTFSKPPARQDEKHMPEELLHQLLEYTRWRPRDDALVRVIADTGIRISAAAAIRWQDVNLEACTVEVYEKKNNRLLVTVFGKDCQQALYRLYEVHQDKGISSEYVFTSLRKMRDNPSGFVHEDYLGNVISRAAKVAGIGTWGPHSLRHLKVKQLLEETHGDFNTVAAAIGDTPQQIMESYNRFNNSPAAHAALKATALGVGKPVKPPSNVVQVDFSRSKNG